VSSSVPNTNPYRIVSSLPSRAPDGLGGRYRVLLLRAWGRTGVSVVSIEGNWDDGAVPEGMTRSKGIGRGGRRDAPSALAAGAAAGAMVREVTRC
jgi:hypothetical protein